MKQLFKKSLFYILIFLTKKIILAQNPIALWNYNTISGAPLTTTTDVGTGVSSIVGALVVANAATGMDALVNNGCGAQNGSNPGAWSFTANPGATNESSGVQYSASTIGFQNIRFTWDQRWSNTATNTVRLQYTLDGTTWTNFDMSSTNTTFCNGTINNGRFQNNGVGDQYRRISVDLSSINGANNNSNFGVRILAAHYQLTNEFRQTSNASLIATAGTWRFDNVSFQGQANISISSTSNFAQYNENIGLINVPITVANANNTPINLTFGLSVYSDATENIDYTWTNTLTIPANTNGITNLPITIVDDLLAEKAERIIVKIISGVNANISLIDNYQIIFIKDNDYVAPTPTNELNLTLLSSYSNGASGTNSAEIVAFDSSVNRLYIANSVAGKLDIVNFSNPSSPTAISSVNLSTYGAINCVIAYDSVVACAIDGIPAQNNGKVVFFDYNGNFINQVEVGAMPDMLTFNKNYTKILTANEGEPNANYSADPVGSVTIIDLTPGYAALTNANVTTIDFTSYNGQENALRAQGIRIFSTSASVAQDLEPEYIAISDDNTKAFVTLQENNALATINLNNNTISSLVALGYSSYSSGSNNAMDASDQSGAVLITGNLPIKGAYMPDAIHYKNINGQGLLFTANEGDSREFGTVIDANRISSPTFNNLLDPTIFPDQSILRNNNFLGRLSALKYSGDTDGDGDYDELHVLGGRSYSIWNAQSGALVYDSKDLIEQITANHPTFSTIFNASNTTGAPALKNRSDDKGPEPEGIEVTTINGSNYAFVALERIGGVMMFNVDNPSAPVYVGYANNRSTTASGPDLGAEGIIIIPASESPNGNTLVILANEVSSTLSIYQVNTCAELSGAPITANQTNFCSGQSAIIATSNSSVSIINNPDVSYEWLKNGISIPNANSSSYTASQSGLYSVRLSNVGLGCIDTSNAIAVTVNLLPTVSAGNNQSVCAGNTVILNGSGASTYNWNNNVQDGVSFVPSTTQTYTVTGTDVNGCSDSSQVSVTVNTLPTVSAGNNQAICAGDTITLNGSGASTYNWNNNVQDGVSFVPSTTQTYTVIGTDANGCSDSSQVTVTINILPTVSAGNNQAICAGDTITLNGSGADTYAWNNNVQNGVSFVPSTTQTYTVIGTDANGCSDKSQVAITLNPLPQVSISTPSDTLCSNSSLITLDGFPTGGFYSGIGVIGNNFDPQLVGIGNYIVTYTYSDNNSCNNSADLTIVVDACTGVNQIADSKIIIYPNPASGFVIIQSPTNTSSTYTMYDISGKEIIRGVLNLPNQQINLDNFSQGVYLLRIQNNIGTKIHRIVVKK